MSQAVFFFGGYQATIGDIKAWKADAIKQKPGVAFEGFPYPDGVTWDGEAAVKAFRKAKDLARAVKLIGASPADTIFIVGHSSGCAIANEVDDELSDHKKIVLVALDGYSPRNAQLERPSTQGWVAQSSTGSSLQFTDLKDRVDTFTAKAKNPTKLNIFPASSSASTKLALHFSLVNLASGDALVKHIPDGYKNCQTNLPWLP